MFNVFKNLSNRTGLILPGIIVGLVVVILIQFYQTKYHKSRYEGAKAELLHLEATFDSYKKLYNTSFNLLIEGAEYTSRVDKLIQDKLNNEGDEFNQEFFDWYYSPIPSGVYDLFNNNPPE